MAKISRAVLANRWKKVSGVRRRYRRSIAETFSASRTIVVSPRPFANHTKTPGAGVVGSAYAGLLLFVLYAVLILAIVGGTVVVILKRQVIRERVTACGSRLQERLMFALARLLHIID